MWLMCVHDPQMSLGFAASGQPFDKELYKFYEKKGGVVHLTMCLCTYMKEELSSAKDTSCKNNPAITGCFV